MLSPSTRTGQYYKFAENIIWNLAANTTLICASCIIYSMPPFKAELGQRSIESSDSLTRCVERERRNSPNTPYPSIRLSAQNNRSQEQDLSIMVTSRVSISFEDRDSQFKPHEAIGVTGLH